MSELSQAKDSQVQWQIASCPNWLVGRYLAAGWEPFAAQRLDMGSDLIWVKRLMDADEEES